MRLKAGNNSAGNNSAGNNSAGNSVMITLPPNAGPRPTGYFLMVNVSMHNSANKTFVIFDTQKGAELLVIPHDSSSRRWDG